MNTNFKEMLKRRITQPSNATSSFAKYLSDLGYDVRMLPHSNRKVLTIDNKDYIITITGANREKILCRQYNSNEYDGIVSFSEKNGKVYKVNDKWVNTGYKSNREMHGKEFVRGESQKNIVKCPILDESIPYKAYKIMYEEIAKEVADNIVNKVRSI